ncbi:hypothetical protein [Streptomyces sp. TRM64462]|uniref:hypothetical protein n=1 Tax=Streptomyces sp. TRM64462 TaxID=2741726 RepID=UPI0028165F67|nr:hypothetical protein [Streptomyces sp. TRM64462]
MSETEPTGAEPTDVERTDAGPGRRRSPLAVSLVAAAVLAAGGGTYLAVAAAGGERGGTENAAVADGRGGGPGLSPAPSPSPSGGETAPGIAPGEPDPSGGMYRVAGPLPKGPEKAHAYRPQGAADLDDVQRLARLLGVPGTPQRDDAGWRIGPQKDGTGPILRVNREAPATWSYDAGGPVTDNCPKGAKKCPPGSPTGKPVGEEAAKKAAAPVLTALGLDDARLDASQVMDAVRVVNADPVVAGFPTFDWATGIRVGPGGEVVGGSGRLLEPVKGPSYPVMSAEQAVRELNESVAHRGRIGGCATPVPHDGPGRAMGGDGTADSPTGTDPGGRCEPSAGSATPPATVTIHGAVFGLAGQLEKGRQALVPSWLFDAQRADGERYRFAFPAVPVEKLAPEPGEPGATHTRVDRYAATDRTLTVWFTGGVCSRYTVRAEETPTEVRVRVYETPIELDRICIAIAVDLSDTVTLREPLGDRKVVDAVSGEAVPRR